MKNKKIAIIGAGISGLSLAYFLQKQNPSADITIFEAADRVGGWIRSKHIDGDVFECGPRTLRVGKKSKALMQLIQELGLDNQLLVAHESSGTKYLANEGSLIQTPRSIWSLLSTQLGRVAVRGLMKDLFACSSDQEDESVSSFFSRRFGKHFVDTFIDPMMAGIYAASPERISMQSAFPDLFDREKRYRSLLFGSLIEFLSEPQWSHPFLGSIATFRDGMETLSREILQSLSASIYLNTKVHDVSMDNGGVIIRLPQEEAYFDRVISTTHPAWARKCIEVPEVPMTSVAAISLGFKKEYDIPNGFGFLTSHYEEKELLGVVFDSCSFPEQALTYRTKLSVMMGGSRAPYLLDCSEDDLREKACAYCKKYLHINDVPDVSQVTYARNAIAVYPIHHQLTIKKMERYLQGKPISFIGASLYGVSLSDCVAKSFDLAQTLVVNNQ